MTVPSLGQRLSSDAPELLCTEEIGGDQSPAAKKYRDVLETRQRIHVGRKLRKETELRCVPRKIMANLIKVIQHTIAVN
jgi:hypothetical protein